MSVFAHPDFDRHEQVVFCHDQASGLKAIIAIHDLNLAARFCDEVLVMKHGKKIVHDTPHNVFTPKVLERVYGIRAKVIEDEGVPVVCPV